MWSFGVVLFLLLSGDAPFRDPKPAVSRIFFGLTRLFLLIFFVLFKKNGFQSLYQKIKSGNFHFKSDAWKDVSVPAAEFVRKLLVVEQTERLTIDEALADAWFSIPEGEEFLIVILYPTFSSLFFLFNFVSYLFV
jgi:serine/threonine protein kinase